VNRALNWLRQAERDLLQAESSQREGLHEWACFAAQQAAEKAVKALHLHLGQDACGQVVAKLLTNLPDHIAVPPDLIEKAKVLDTFYIPTSYPNGFSEGASYEHYGPLQSEEAIRYAREVVEFARAEMA